VRSILRFTAALALALIPIIVQAANGCTQFMGRDECVRVWGPAQGLTGDQAMRNLITMLMLSGYAFCGAIFLAGAFFFIVSLGRESRSGLGKGMMIGAVIGAIVISGAKVILNTVMFFVYKT